MWDARLKFVAAVIASSLLLTAFVNAQPERRPDMPGRRPPRERVEEYKKMKLIEVLELEEDAAVRFFTKYDKHEKEQQAVHREMMETINDIEKLVRENVEDAEFEKAFSKLHELQQKMEAERERFLKDLREILTARQVGKLVVFERGFMERVQDIVREMDRERMRERMKERWQED